MKLTKKYRTIKNKTKKGGTRSNKNQSNRAVKATKPPKKQWSRKIPPPKGKQNSVHYVNIAKHIALLMTNNEEIGVIRTTLNKHFGNSEKCRKFFSSSPDTECRNARDLNLNHEDNACNGYLTIRQRNDYNQYFNANNFDIRQERDIGIIVNDQQLRSNKNKNEVGIWGSWYNEKKKKRRRRIQNRMGRNRKMLVMW